MSSEEREGARSFEGRSQAFIDASRHTAKGKCILMKSEETIMHAVLWDASKFG